MFQIGCFSQINEIQHLCCFITQLVKKLQQWSLYEVIEHILPFIWIQNGLWAIFGCWVISKTVLGVCWKIWNFEFFRKHQKLFIEGPPMIKAPSRHIILGQNQHIRIVIVEVVLVFYVAINNCQNPTLTQLNSKQL